MDFSTQHTIDFRTQLPIPSDDFFTIYRRGTSYDVDSRGILLSGPDASIMLTSTMSGRLVPVKLMFGIAKKNNIDKSSINIVVNNTYLEVSPISVLRNTFYDIYLYPNIACFTHLYNNIGIKLAVDSDPVLLNYFGVYPVVPVNLNSWMNEISDDKNIADINIPGSHDAAAIITGVITRTPYGCHTSSITQQLNSGIRLFDIRIKIKKNSQGLYKFITCHGSLGSMVGLNEYEDLKSVLDQARNFLTANSREGLIISLKIDDWNGLRKTDEENILEQLGDLLKGYPIITSVDNKYKICTMGYLRGKFFLINRLNFNPAFGAPVAWENNTVGEFAKGDEYRDFKVYVQDQWKVLSTNEKAQSFLAALAQKTSGTVLLNYASATWMFLLGIYIDSPVLSFFGKKPAETRDKIFGWVFMDRENDTCPVTVYTELNFVKFIVDSNFGYQAYPLTFEIISINDEL